MQGWSNYFYRSRMNFTSEKQALYNFLSCGDIIIRKEDLYLFLVEYKIVMRNKNYE